MTGEEKVLLQRMKAGEFDGPVGNDLVTSGGSFIWKVIKDGVAMMLKQGPGGKLFNGKENESYPGKTHVLEKWESGEELLEFLRKFGWLMNDPKVQDYSAKFKPKK